jgi:hypothetical protein
MKQTIGPNDYPPCKGSIVGEKTIMRLLARKTIMAFVTAVPEAATIIMWALIYRDV